MAADNDPGGIPVVSLVQHQGGLPPEMWAVVFSSADYRTLKAIRRVNSVFKTLSSPHLFDHVIYSVDERTLKNLKLLAKHKELGKHVRRIYLDTTSYRVAPDTRQYAQLTASYFQAAFNLPKQPNTSPLSEKFLLRVLRADPVEDLGNKCLSGIARKGYVAGYTTYVARSDYYREQLQDDGIYKQLKDLIPKFPNLKHFETISLWSTLNGRERFEDHLRRTQPEETLKAIKGLTGTTVIHSDGKLGFSSSYCAPGQTSRRLNPLTPPPNFSGCWGDSTVFDLLTAALRALHECKPKLESLSLPGSDNIGEHMPLRGRIGIIPIPAVLTVPRSTAASKKTLLLPLFEGLKSLELKLDFAHPGTQNTFRHHIDPSRLCAALQKMPKLEKLSLGAVDYPEEAQADPWSIYETMLRSEGEKDLLPDWNASDHDDEEDDGFGDGLGGLGGLAGGLPAGMPADLQGMTLGMLAASLGILPPQAAPPPPQAAAGAGAGAGAASAPAPATVPGAPVASNTSNVSANPTPAPSPNNNPFPKLHHSTPLKPNPWPKLRHLSLFNMPATKEDMFRLIRTISTSPLQSISLENVYLDDRLQTYNGTVSSPTPPPSYPYENIAPHWLEIIDLMADELHTKLKSATVSLSERDADCMFDLLSERIEFFDEISPWTDVSDMIGAYILSEASGSGFATYVRSKVQDSEDDEDYEDWDDEDDEDDEDSEGVDEDMPHLI